MTYDARETSAYSGQPVELYRFARQSTTWLYTSADADQVVSGLTYTAIPIQRGPVEQSEESHSGNITVTVPATNPVALLFSDYLPVWPVSLTITRFHRSDAETAIIFLGDVASISRKDGQTTLTCRPLSEGFRRPVPWPKHGAQCTRVHYGTACGLIPSAWRHINTVISVTGTAVEVTGLSAKGADWAVHGTLETPDGDTRWIVGQSGNTVTLLNAAALSPGETVIIQAGCDMSEATCRAKFNNIVNHMGFGYVPAKNPFDSAGIE